MKKNQIYLLMVLAGGLFFSCKKAAQLIYSPDTDAVNIQLGINVARPDSLEYNFAFKSTNPVDSIICLAKLMGQAADHDRTFVIKAIGGDTNRVKLGTHYTFGNYVIKANTFQTVFPIYIKRTADFKTTPARIIFGISDKGNLKKGLIESSTLVVIFKDAFAKPANWDLDTYPYVKLATYFGVYSNVKFQFITTSIGQAPIFRVLSTGTPGLNEIDYTTVTHYRITSAKQLSLLNAANPTAPLRDENNNLITIP